jgi:FHA domain
VEQERISRLARQNPKGSEPKLSGNVIISELIRNMEVGRFEMAYTVLLPCVFTVYLNPEDHAALSGVFDHVIEDAKRALRARVAELNKQRTSFLKRKENEIPKEHKIACQDWNIEFFPEVEVPRSDVEIHSELNEIVQPGYRGTKTTLLEREPSAATRRISTDQPGNGRLSESIYAEIRYQDESGPQIYPVSQNQVKVGRSGDHTAVDLPLQVSDEVSREHLTITRDAATGAFFITDCSTNGTWLNGKRLRKGVKEKLPAKAEINVGEVLILQFEAR